MTDGKKKTVRLLKNNNLLKNGSLSVFGSIMIRAVDLISIPIFTRLLDAATYGRVSVFTTYVQIFVVLLSLDTHGCVARATQEYYKEKEKYYCATLLFSIVWTGIVFALFNIFHGLAENLLSMKQFEFNILIIYSFSYFVILYKSNEYIFNLRYKNNIIMSCGMAVGNLSLSLLLVLSLFSDNRFLGRILGAAIPAIIIAGIVLYKYLQKGCNNRKWEHIKYALKFGVPLLPHDLSHMVLSNSDRIMIQNMIGNGASGIYSLTYNVGLMMHVVTEGLGNVWIPMLFRNLEANRRQIIRRHARIFLIGFTAIAVGVIAVSPEIIKVISAKEYWSGIDIVMWICLSTYFVFVYQLFVNVEFYHKKTPVISGGSIIAALINILLNLYGIPVYGYGFAAISTVISYGALVLFHCFVLNFIIKDCVIDNIFTLGTAALMIGITFLFHCMRNNIINRVLLLIAVEALVFIVFIVLLKKEKKYKVIESVESI